MGNKSNKIRSSFSLLAKTYHTTSDDKEKKEIVIKSTKLLTALIEAVNPNNPKKTNIKTPLLSSEQKQTNNEALIKHRKEITDFLLIIGTTLWDENSVLGNQLKRLFDGESALRFALEHCEHYAQINELLMSQFAIIDSTRLPEHSSLILKHYRRCKSGLLELHDAYFRLKTIITTDKQKYFHEIWTQRIQVILKHVTTIIEKKLAMDITKDFLVQPKYVNSVYTMLSKLKNDENSALYERITIDCNYQPFDTSKLNMTFNVDTHGRRCEQKVEDISKEHADEFERYLVRCSDLLDDPAIDDRLKNRIYEQLASIDPKYFNYPQRLHHHFDWMVNHPGFKNRFKQAYQCAKRYLDNEQAGKNPPDDKDHTKSRIVEKTHARTSDETSNIVIAARNRQAKPVIFSKQLDLCEEKLSKEQKEIIDSLPQDENVSVTLNRYISKRTDLLPLKAYYERATEYFLVLDKFITNTLNTEEYSGIFFDNLKEHIRFAKEEMFARHAHPFANFVAINCANLSHDFQQQVDTTEQHLMNLENTFIRRQKKDRENFKMVAKLVT